MWLALEAMGLPAYIIKALQALYQNNHHYLSFNGFVFYAFCGAAGVRQGCPASTSLFVIVTDPIIRAMCLRLPRSCLVRAYADDIAVVLSKIWEQAPMLAAVFAEIAKFSGLKLKPRKCCVMLLWRYSKPACSKLLIEAVPAWRDFQLTAKGKYLGFWIGPGAFDHSWCDPAAKFINRCKYIRGLGMGFTISLLLYRMLAFSCLQFVAQIVPVPSWMEKREREGLSIIAAGPRHWISSEALCNLDSIIGFPLKAQSLAVVSMAARARTALVTLPCWRTYVGMIEEGWQCENRPLCPPLSAWYKHSTALSIRDAFKTLEDKHFVRRGAVIDKALFEKIASGQKVQPYLVATLASSMCSFSPSAFFTHRWSRWFAADELRSAIQGASRVRTALNGKVPACVLHALLISWFNGWCTSRRLQEDVGPCRLCRDCHGNDELEHYLRCPYAWAASPRFALLGPIPRSMSSALLLSDVNHESYAHRATMIFAIYGAFNLARAKGSRLSSAELRLVLLERFRTAMQRWPRSAPRLDGRAPRTDTQRRSRRRTTSAPGSLHVANSANSFLAGGALVTGADWH